MRHIHLAVLLLVCSFITLSFTKSTVVYRRYHRKRPALRRTHKNVIEIVEVFKTIRKPPAFIKSDQSIEKFLMCDAKCERKRFLKRRKMCIRTGRYCPTRPSRPKIPTKTQINVSTRPIYNKPTVYDQNPYGNRNPDYTHLYPWSRPSVTVTKYPPDGSKNFNMTIVEVKNDTIPTTVKDDYEYYDVDNDDRQQHRRSTTFRVPTNHEFSTTMQTIETTTPIPLTTETDVLSTTVTTSTDIISSSSEYFSTTIGTSTFATSSAATEAAYTEIPQSTTLKTFVTTSVIDTSSSTQVSPDEYWSSVVPPELIDRATTEDFIPSTPQGYAPNTAPPAVEISTTEILTTEKTTTERTTTEISTTEEVTTEALTTEALTTEALTTTTEISTTEILTTERTTTERSTTEALTTEASTTEILTTERQLTSTTEELTTPSTTSTSTTEISITMPTATQPVITFPSSTVGLNSSTDITTTTVSSSPIDEDEYIEEDYVDSDDVVGEEGDEGGEEVVEDGEGENGEGENGEGEGTTYDYDDDGNYDEDEEE